MATKHPTWRDLFNTPGFSTEDPSTWPTDYMRERASVAVKKATISDRHKAAFLPVPERKPTVKPELVWYDEAEKIPTLSIKQIEELMKKKEELADKMKTKPIVGKNGALVDEGYDMSLETLADEINAFIKVAPPEHFQLGEPIQLTVKKKDGNYSKRPHIGGEGFRIVRCYAGKKNNLIYCFEPLEAADYAEMEMTEAQAKKALLGFSTFIKNVGGYEFEQVRKEAMSKAALEAEKAKNAGKEQQYAELGYATW